MDFVELSDLEEGEILEYDSFSPVVSNEDFEMKKRPLGLTKRENTNCQFGIKDGGGRNLSLNQPRKYGFVNKNLREKVRFNGSAVQYCMKTVNLDSVSSEGEYISDNDGKYQVQHKGRSICNGGMRKERKQSAYNYGTVEDIMSEIGETICRKSRCNYKKRKSKDFVRYSDNSYDLWRDKVFSSHIKEKNRKRKLSESDSEGEMCKGQVNKRRRRRKKRGNNSECGGVGRKNLKARDFDEMRRNLLEKLNKQKAAEALKALTNSAPAEVENSEIQEVDMLVDCTNYVDNPPASVEENTVNGVGSKKEKEGDEELDLIKLRLIALASNKKGKNGGNQSKEEMQESVQEEKKSSDSNSVKEVDVDRNELLLRAEALKTALLKKHQNRLKKLREKLRAVGSSSDNDVNACWPPGQEKEASKEKEVKNTQGISTENHRVITAEDGKVPEPPSEQVLSNFQMSKPDAWMSNVNPKKGNAKVRSRRRKKKSHLLANSLKENSEKSEAMEEDDRKLRSQLLNDLLMRKSLKDLERKSVLMDSVQAAANQIPLVTHESSNDNEKLPATEKNPLKKVSVSKAPKPVPVPKIPVPEIQRIIVHLGSEDSSDENGPQEEERALVGESKGDAGVEETAKAESASTKETVQENNIQASYEKSVELLLSEARKKIEGKLELAKTNALTTPEAVYKHLPPSQRLEYMRLKQKIAERERLKKQKNEESSADSKRVDTPNPDASDGQKEKTETKAENSVAMGSAIGSSSGFPSAKTAVPHVRLTSVVRNVNGTIVRTPGPKVVGNKSKNNLVGAHGKAVKGKGLAAAGGGPKAPQTSNSLLLPSSQALISKLKLLLKKIKIEKTIEENYEKEISKLKNQLNLFERKKTEQRFKIKKLGEESMKTYRAIQGITGKSKEKVAVREESGVEKEKKKEESGRLKEGGKESQEGKTVPCEPEKRTSKVESEKDKEQRSEVCGGGGDGGVGGDDVRRTKGTVSSETPSVAGLAKYSSPLEAFKKVSIGSGKVDPNVMMCQFDLLGTCKDEECTYQHLRRKS